VPKLTRDLLPSHRGKDPGGHSIFTELILPDDSIDGSRSLRKRKASQEDDVQSVRQTRKKRRSSEVSGSMVAVSAARSSPHPRGESAVTDGGDSDDTHNSGSEPESSRLRSSRARRAKPLRKDKRPLVWIEESQGLSLVVVFHLTNEKVQKIVTSKPKKKILTVEQERQGRRRERDRERRERKRQATQAARETVEDSHYPAVQHHYTAPFHGFADKEMDENKSKPFGGILSEADADTSKTYPTPADRKKFEDARQRADNDWKLKQEALYASEEPAKRSKESGPPSKIKCVNFGGYEIDTWHAAPYPEEYSKNKVLYICEFCLKYMPSDYVAWRHKVREIRPPFSSHHTAPHANKRSSNVLQSTHRATKSTATATTHSSKSTAEKTQSTARTSVCSLNSS
jgi:histone acetyltransferase SAS3